MVEFHQIEIGQKIRVYLIRVTVVGLTHRSFSLLAATEMKEALVYDTDDLAERQQMDEEVRAIEAMPAVQTLLQLPPR